MNRHLKGFIEKKFHRRRGRPEEIAAPKWLSDFIGWGEAFDSHQEVVDWLEGADWIMEKAQSAGRWRDLLALEHERPVVLMNVRVSISARAWDKGNFRAAYHASVWRL